MQHLLKLLRYWGMSPEPSNILLQNSQQGQSALLCILPDSIPSFFLVCIHCQLSFTLFSVYTACNIPSALLSCIYSQSSYSLHPSTADTSHCPNLYTILLYIATGHINPLPSVPVYIVCCNILANTFLHILPYYCTPFSDILISSYSLNSSPSQTALCNTFHIPLWHILPHVIFFTLFLHILCSMSPQSYPLPSYICIKSFSGVIFSCRNNLNICKKKLLVGISLNSPL